MSALSDTACTPAYAESLCQDCAIRTFLMMHKELGLCRCLLPRSCGGMRWHAKGSNAVMVALAGKQSCSTLSSHQAHVWCYAGYPTDSPASCLWSSAPYLWRAWQVNK